jgi:hypothetical protein
VQPSQPRWRAELHSNLRRGSGAPPGAVCTKGGPVKATPQARCCPPGVVGSLCLTTLHTVPSSDTHGYQLPADTCGPSPTSSPSCSSSCQRQIPDLS